MGAVLGLGVGVGLVLVFSAFVVPRRPVRLAGPSMRPLLARAGLSEVRPAGLAVVSAACAVVAFVAVQVLSRTPPVALAFGCIGAYLPFAVLRGRARRRQREFAEVWPEAVDNLASGIRAGLALPEALAGLAVRGPEPLREPFAAFALDYQASGRFLDALDRLKERLADPVGDRVVEALRVAREVGGGDLGRLLRSLSSFLRDDARTRSELESRQAWTVKRVCQLTPSRPPARQAHQPWPPMKRKLIPRRFRSLRTLSVASSWPGSSGQLASITRHPKAS